jgi:fused signal recognition particle receptor
MNVLQRLSDGLAKTRTALQGALERIVGREGAEPAAWDDLEAALLASDLGVRAVERVIRRARDRRAPVGAADRSGLHERVREAILEALRPCEGETVDAMIARSPRPFVIMAVGVNGVGKTTTVAKLAQRLHRHGHKVLVVAADTFRAAAIEQLAVWTERVGVEIVRHQSGADPAAVVFDGAKAARARGADVVLVDTAGRLHTKTNLMDELRKVKRVLARELPGAPQEVLLVLDATIGQNAQAQAAQFHEAVGVTGMALTKLDGTARGGVIVAIAESLRVPVRLIGVGESADDLQDFQAEAFVDALLGPAQPPDRASRAGDASGRRADGTA